MTTAKPSIRELFSQALDVEATQQRNAFLDQACQGDDDVRQKVEDLLAAHASAGKFMNGTGMRAPTVDLPSVGEGPGSCIGPYKLREQIGDGGFGVVYVAEQERPVARKVALKIIKPGMDTKDVIARFEAERQALALMDHPNVAKVLDAGATESGRPYFVMELVHGTAITDFCDEQKLSNRQRLELLIDVCRAVQHAHQKGIIHRDLKPSNIMVTMHDDKPVPKVIDFGVAKALSQKLTEKTVYTAYGQMVGTPLYMSPEQAQMSGLDVDTRSDIYSLGVLLYELLTGTTPFDKQALREAGYDEIRRIIREDDPPCPSARVSTLNAHLLSAASDCRRIDQRKLSQSLRGELDWIVMKALEKDRSRRYESASNLAQDVQNYMNDEPVEACPPSLGYRFRKFARRNRMALASSALVALALFLGTIVSSWQAVRANDAKADADKQRGAAVLNAERAEESERDARRNEGTARAERDSAVAAREEVRRVLYASEMNLAQDAWEDNHFGRVSQLLKNTTPRSGEKDIRGFEWHYWNRRLNGPLETHSVTMPQIGTRRMLEDTLSPDGSHLAVQYFDQDKISVAIWDIATLREVCNFELSRGTIHSERTAMLFSPDGTRLAIPIRRTGNLRIWDTRTGEQLSQVEDKERVFRVFFSRDGNRVVYTYGTTEKEREERSPSDYGYKVWDLTSNKILFSHQYKGEAYPNLVFLSPDGKKLGVRIDSKDRKALHLQIWDVDTAKVLQDRAFDDRYWYRAVSPDGSRIAVQDQVLRNQFMILDSKTLKTVSILHRGPDQVTLKVVFSPDGRLLAASTDTRKVLIWSLPTSPNKDDTEPVQIPSPLFTLPVPRSHVELRFSPDSRQLHSCIHSHIRSWKIPLQLSPKKRLPWSSGGVIGGSFNNDGTRAVLRANPKTFNMAMQLLIWDVEADREIWRYEDPRGDRAFANPVFGPNGRFIVVPSRKAQTSRRERPTVFHDELHVLDARTGKLIRTHKPEDAYNIDSMVFNPAGTHVAVFVTRRRPSGERISCHVVLWNIATGEESLAIDIKERNPQLVGFSRDGKGILVGQRISGGLLVLDTATGVRRRIIAPEGTILNQFGKWSLSPDGTTLAVLGVKDRYNEIAVEFYNAATGEPGLRIPVHTEYPPIAIRWGPDGSRLALVSSQWTSTDVSIWDTRTGRLVVTLKREGLAGGNNRSLRFSPDNYRLLHIAADNRIESGAWDNPSTHPIHIWDATPLVESVE